MQFWAKMHWLQIEIEAAFSKGKCSFKMKMHFVARDWSCSFEMTMPFQNEFIHWITYFATMVRTDLSFSSKEKLKAILNHGETYCDALELHFYRAHIMDFLASRNVGGLRNILHQPNLSNRWSTEENVPRCSILQPSSKPSRPSICKDFITFIFILIQKPVSSYWPL